MTHSSPPTAAPGVYPRPPRSRALRACRWLLRWSFRAALACVLLAAFAAGYLWFNRPVPTPITQIYQGVYYECRRLPDTPLTGGLAHLIRVDLTAPGIELYITPQDPSALAAGWEYFTRWTPAVAREQNTAVLVNGVYFKTPSDGLRLPGAYASTEEILITEHHVNHEWEKTYLLWFGDDLTPHAEAPPGTDAIAHARWAMGCQSFACWYGKINDAPGPTPDRRMMVGISPGTKQLYFGVFDHVTTGAGARVLADFGATCILPYDGGTSTALVIGQDAKGIHPGTYVYPLRAIPVHFGVRARKL